MPENPNALLEIAIGATRTQRVPRAMNVLGLDSVTIAISVFLAATDLASRAMMAMLVSETCGADQASKRAINRNQMRARGRGFRSAMKGRPIVATAHAFKSAIKRMVHDKIRAAVRVFKNAIRHNRTTAVRVFPRVISSKTHTKGRVFKSATRHNRTTAVRDQIHATAAHAFRNATSHNRTTAVHDQIHATAHAFRSAIKPVVHDKIHAADSAFKRAINQRGVFPQSAVDPERSPHERELRRVHA
jgi:hypothetical protein